MEKALDYHALFDFVNDRVWRDGKSVLFGDYRIDDVINILTNKLGAIMDRDEEKDVFDLMAIAHYETLECSQIIAIAQKKSFLDPSVLIERLRLFLLEWMKNSKALKPFMIDQGMIHSLWRQLNMDNFMGLQRRSMKRGIA